jgi:hypothetical protein
VAAVKVVLSQETLLTRIAGTGFALSDDYDDFPGQVDLYVYADPPIAFGEDPDNPLLAQHFEGGVVFLGGASPPLHGGLSSTGHAYRYLEFDVQDVALPAGTYWISLSRVVLNGLFWAQTTTDLGGDIYTSNVFQPDYLNLKDDFGYNPGTIAVDVFGVPKTD